jgi:altronate dehydratase
MLDLTVDIASGERSVGEKAGHSQVSLWRDWKQTGPVDLDPLLTESELKSGEPIAVDTSSINASSDDLRFHALQTEVGYRTDQVGLILPTSLCSGQIAQMIAHRCNEQQIGENQGISRFVALPHTEGCGVSGGRSEEIYTRTMIGHLTHPTVALGLLLEHGCEKTHNDHVRHEIQNLGISPEGYGWASVQLDGGIDAVIEKVQDWFSEELSNKPTVPTIDVGLEHLCIAVTSTGKATGEVSQSLTQLTQTIVAAGGTIIVPENAGWLSAVRNRQQSVGLLKDTARTIMPTLAYGQRVEKSGFHIMETPTDQPTETLTGLGATGVDLALAHIVGAPLQSHVMVPLIQVSTDATTQNNYGADLDLETANADDLLALIAEVASRQYTPKLHGKGNTDFQLTRGLLGISM